MVYCWQWFTVGNVVLQDANQLAAALSDMVMTFNTQIEAAQQATNHTYSEREAANHTYRERERGS